MKKHNFKEPVTDFIKKLMEMMQIYPDLLNWENQGQELVILNKDQFEFRVLREYFRHGKMQSFIRQLNMYGFHKVCRSNSSMNFRNKYFYKGNEQNFNLIKRRKRDCDQQSDEGNGKENELVSLLKDKHDKEFPELHTIVENILIFKSKTSKTMIKLKKTMDLLNKEINQRKGKIVKPIVAQIKEMITLIDDSAKKAELNIEQIIQALNCEVKEQQIENQPLDQNRQIRQVQGQLNQQEGQKYHREMMSYAALHNANMMNNPFLNHQNRYISVSSMCSNYSVTNFMNF